MKQRLLVMNGQKLLQEEQDGQWVTTRVDKAGAIRPGLYNLYLSEPADRTRHHDGMIVHADRDGVYQQVGKTMIRHELVQFGRLPESGRNASIRYKEQKAQVDVAAVKRGRGVTR